MMQPKTLNFIHALCYGTAYNVGKCYSKDPWYPGIQYFTAFFGFLMKRGRR